MIPFTAFTSLNEFQYKWFYIQILLQNRLILYIDAQVVAVAARNLKSAEEFGVKHNISKKYGSYKELVSDSEVVYSMILY